MQPGPAVTRLTHRLLGTPAVILAAPYAVTRDPLVLSSAAMLSDALYDCGTQPLTSHEVEFMNRGPGAGETNLLRLVQVVSYVLADTMLREMIRAAADPQLTERVLELCRTVLPELAKVVTPEYCVNDDEGREEIVRTLLAALQIVPEGESEAQARDRLSAIDSVERTRVIAQTRAAQKRARELREAMARRAAEEAASKMSRE
jgi:hypothetical protein